MTNNAEITSEYLDSIIGKIKTPTNDAMNILTEITKEYKAECEKNKDGK